MLAGKIYLIIKFRTTIVTHGLGCNYRGCAIIIITELRALSVPYISGNIIKVESERGLPFELRHEVYLKIYGICRAEVFGIVIIILFPARTGLYICSYQINASENRAERWLPIPCSSRRNAHCRYDK